MVSVKGLLFDVAREVVAEVLGEDEWDRAVEAAGVEGAYTSLGNYPDAEMVSLVDLIASTAGLTRDETLRTVGIHGYPHLARRHPELVAGVDDLGALLHSLNSVIHPEVLKLYPDSTVPSFDVVDVAEDRWHVTYDSRRGMCRLAEGLIVGGGASLGTTTEVTHLSCVHDGDGTCVLEVTAV